MAVTKVTVTLAVEDDGHGDPIFFVQAETSEPGFTPRKEVTNIHQLGEMVAAIFIEGRPQLGPLDASTVANAVKVMQKAPRKKKEATREEEG